MAFPLYFLEQLRDRINLVDLISCDIKLDRRGHEWLGLCPFHQEKTPSFHVVPDKQFYHCFGCGAHGDALKFLREHHKLPFIEAVKMLADMAGLEMPRQDPRQVQQQTQQENLSQVMEKVVTWYRQQLHTPEGKRAREYLQQRGVAAELQDHFDIGYASGNHQAMLQALDVSADTARSLGLLGSGERGDYAFFRQRLMFAIRDEQGRAIAFGGRRLQEDQSAKYINSPDTELFHKRETLYHLHYARWACRRQSAQLLVAEGYMDVVALHSAGFIAAVAPLGTALTLPQLQSLWRLHDAPIMCLDGDAAGQKAAAKVAHLALGKISAGQNIRFAFLPGGEDPDSLIRQQGQAVMQSLLDQAVGLGEFLWQSESQNCIWSQPESVSTLRSRLAAMEKSIDDAHVRTTYRQFWRDRLWQASRSSSAYKPQPATGKMLEVSPVPATRASVGVPYNLLTRAAFATLINHPALIEEFAEAFQQIDFSAPLDILWQKIHMYQSQCAEEFCHREHIVTWLVDQHQQHILEAILNPSVYMLAPDARPTASEDAARHQLVRLQLLVYEQQLIVDGRQRLEHACQEVATLEQVQKIRQEIQHLRRMPFSDQDEESEGS